MVRETLTKIPENVKRQLDEYKRLYNGLPDRREETIARSAGYLLGLRDAGIITERERQILFVYTTV